VGRSAVPQRPHPDQQASPGPTLQGAATWGSAPGGADPSTPPTRAAFRL